MSTASSVAVAPPVSTSSALRRAGWTLVLAAALGTPASFVAAFLTRSHVAMVRNASFLLVLLDVLLQTLPISMLRAALRDRAGTDRLDLPLRAYVATVIFAEITGHLVVWLSIHGVTGLVLEVASVLPHAAVMIWLGFRILNEPGTLFGLRPWWGWLTLLTGALAATTVLLIGAIPFSIGSIICQGLFLLQAANSASVR